MSEFDSALMAVESSQSRHSVKMVEKSRSRGRFRWILVVIVLPLVVCFVLVLKKPHIFYDKAAPVPGPPGAPVKKYANALEIAMQFFDIQKCLEYYLILPVFDLSIFSWFILQYIQYNSFFFLVAGKLVDNMISWRGDSGLKDGSEARLDLSKGMYDAGDHMKFGFPMAFTATVLSWAILEYGDQMESVNQSTHAKRSLKWITDYLIKAHPSENVLYIQVAIVTFIAWHQIKSKFVETSIRHLKCVSFSLSNIGGRWVILKQTITVGTGLKS